MGFPISGIVKAKKNLFRPLSLKGSDLYSKGIFCSVRWREREKEICNSNIFVEGAFIPRFIELNGRRIWIRSCNGWYHNLLQRRHLLQSHFSVKCVRVEAKRTRKLKFDLGWSPKLHQKLDAWFCIQNHLQRLSIRRARLKNDEPGLITQWKFLTACADRKPW